jgi:hypothetical protein
MFAPGLRNQLYDEMPLFREIMDGAGTAAGVSLIHKVPLFRTLATGIVSGYNPMVTQDQNLLVNASLNWANIYYANISLSMDEIMENSGAQGVEKLVDLLKTKTNAAKTQLKENVYTDLYGSATNDAAGNFTLVGLAAAAGSITNTYAGILRTTTANAGWLPNLYATTVADDVLLDPTTKATYFPSLLRRYWMAAAHDQAPNIIVTTKNLYEILQFIAERNNLILNGNVANLSFSKVQMSGSDAKQAQKDPPVFWDSYCTTKHVYGLTTENWKAWVFPNANFEPADVFGDGHIWQHGDKQLAGYMTIVWKGQILCEVPRQQFCMTTLGS